MPEGAGNPIVCCDLGVHERQRKRRAATGAPPIRYGGVCNHHSSSYRHDSSTNTTKPARLGAMRLRVKFTPGVSAVKLPVAPDSEGARVGGPRRAFPYRSLATCKLTCERWCRRTESSDLSVVAS